LLPKVLRAPPEPKLASLLSGGPGSLNIGEEGVRRAADDAALHSALALASDLLAKLNVVRVFRAPPCSLSGAFYATVCTHVCERVESPAQSRVRHSGEEESQEAGSETHRETHAVHAQVMSEAGMHTSEANGRDVEHFRGRLAALMADAVPFCCAAMSFARLS
jgi:hypothetical protein